MDIQFPFVIAGLLVGFIVGMTGVGGGSLMTPILLHFGITPTTAVGTDLLYAAITKGGGVFVHQRQGNINWRIMLTLTAGSVPAALATLAFIHYVGIDSSTINAIIKHGVGIALILTSVVIVFKQKLFDLSHREARKPGHRERRARDAMTFWTGVLLGVMVTITSIGAGAIGTMALFFLYPLLPTARLVGTEIAHAVPLTLVAGLGHAGLGNVDWPLLASLLLGSLPGIFIGSHLTGAVPDKVLRPALAVMLVLVGIKLLS